MIWCLPGFLGRAEDWAALRATLGAAGAAIETPDLFASGATLGPRGESLGQWGERLAVHVSARDAQPWLVGYSLGGRLALHALLARPTLWRGAVIVSAHLGLDVESERTARRAEDDRWAARFEREPWASVLDAWNARAVFGDSGAGLDRPETAYDRSALARALRDWSLGTQRGLASRLGAIPCPVLWIAGARDPRYVAQGRTATAVLPRGDLRVAPDAGHRVPWEAPDWFGRTVREFVAET